MPARALVYLVAHRTGPNAHHKRPVRSSNRLEPQEVAGMAVTQGQATPANTSGGPAKEPAYAYNVVVAGIIAIVVVTVAAVLKYDLATQVTAAVAPVIGSIGTLVGAYFGLRGSSLGQQKATDAEVRRAQLQAAPATS
jgi:hypothetical protein